MSDGVVERSFAIDQHWLILASGKLLPEAYS
jgi:hypothetical protein